MCIRDRILGSISAVLLLAGFTNYFNVMVTGILARKKELKIMESVGMTKKQKRTMIQTEGRDNYNADKFQKQIFIFHEFFIYYHAYSAILSNK